MGTFALWCDGFEKESFRSRYVHHPSPVDGRMEPEQRRIADLLAKA